jgi:hypothetical protein
LVLYFVPASWCRCVERLAGFFDQDADSNQVEALRPAVVTDHHALLSTHSNFEEVTVADLNPDIYSEMRGRYRRLLRYGVFKPGKRTVENELTRLIQAYQLHRARGTLGKLANALRCPPAAGENEATTCSNRGWDC